VKEFVGSGPFVFHANEWVSGVRSVYTKFDKYLPRTEAPSNTSGAKVVNFQRVEWVIQPDPGTGASALMAGEVDWVDQPLFDHLPMLGRNAGVTLAEGDPFGLIGGLFMNHQQPPFNNRKLRQALLHAVDQKEFVAAVLGEQARYAKIPVGYFTVGSPFASDAGMAALTGPRDIAKARQLVKDSGYAGETVVLMSPSDQPQMFAMAALCESLFKKLGINVALATTDWGTLLTRRSVTKPASDGGWNAFNTRITGSGGTDPTSVQLRANGPKAWFGWPDIPDLERLREAWFRAPTLAEQQAICREMQTAAFEGVPYIPLGQWSQPTAHRSDLTGFVPSSTHVFWGVRRV
jgi:peptide/nickel transport system substrate-binding protein